MVMYGWLHKRESLFLLLYRWAMQTGVWCTNDSAAFKTIEH